MYRVLIQLPAEQGAWEIYSENKQEQDKKINQFTENYKAFLQDKEQGILEHWESFPLQSKDLAEYWSIGDLRRDTDDMMENRPGMGIRPTAYDYLISIEDLMIKLGKSAQPVTV